MPAGNSIIRNQAEAWLAPILLAVAMALGGGSALFPLPRMIIELAAVPVLVLALHALSVRSLGWAGIVPLVLVAVTLLLFAAQLVPLPSAAWMALPGRALAADTARQLGWAHRWMPLSLDPEATLRAGLTLIPGVALFLAVLAGDDRDQHRMLLVVAAMAVVSLGFGALQALSGWDPTFYPYDSAHQGLPTGLFANRNHQACLLAVAPLAIAAWIAPGVRHRSAALLAAGAALALLCVLGVMATGSRSGSALLLPVAVSVGLIDMRSQGRRSTPRRQALYLVAVAAITGAILLLLANFSGGALLRRFAQMDDQRFGFWPDVVAALRQYLPVGSGFGTFEPVYAAAERLANVGPHYLNHAHNDYLEIAVEGGLAAIALVAAYVAWLLARGTRIWRRSVSVAQVQARYAWVGLLAVLLHSAVDYPLRTLAIQAVFAVFTGMVARALSARAAAGGLPTGSSGTRS
jgi:O-antigen ligase